MEVVRPSPLPRTEHVARVAEAPREGKGANEALVTGSCVTVADVSDKLSPVSLNDGSGDGGGEAPTIV